MQYPIAFKKKVSFVNQFNIFDCLILSTALDVWSRIVRMLKIAGRKVVCNHFEITSILVIEIILDKYYLDQNCVVYMLMVMCVCVNLLQILFSQREGSTPLKHL